MGCDTTAHVTHSALALLAAVFGCTIGCTRSAPTRPDSDGALYPPPRADLVPALGGADTLEIATWNIENFPARPGTPSVVADLITSLDLDILVVEEIADDAAWAELLERLRDHDGVLSTHTYSSSEYQKIGVIYRTAMVAMGPMRLLFEDDTWAFPRPALAITAAIDDGVHPALAIELIGVHLKAGVSAEDGERRRLAIGQLDAHLRAQIAGGGEDEVVIAGDYNEVLDTPSGQANLAPLLAAPDRYTVHTQVASNAGEISFVPTSRLLDHLTTTTGLATETAAGRIVIPRLDSAYSDYVNAVSDHLPVVLIAPL
jgi:Endonuclease/Exonuclease/phosphatase family